CFFAAVFQRNRDPAAVNGIGAWCRARDSVRNQRALMSEYVGRFAQDRRRVGDSVGKVRDDCLISYVIELSGDHRGRNVARHTTLPLAFGGLGICGKIDGKTKLWKFVMLPGSLGRP